MPQEHEEEGREEEKRENPFIPHFTLNEQARKMNEAIERAIKWHNSYQNTTTVHRILSRKQYNGVFYHDIEEYTVQPVDKLTTYIDPEKRRVMLSIYPSSQEENHTIPRPVIMMTEKDLCKLILSLQSTLQDLRTMQGVSGRICGLTDATIQIDETKRIGEEIPAEDGSPSLADLMKMRRRQDDPDYDDDSWYD